jgi:hypothetical protein
MSVEVGRQVFVGRLLRDCRCLMAAEPAWREPQRQGGAARRQHAVAIQLVSDMKRAVRSLSKAPSGEQARHLAS